MKAIFTVLLLLCSTLSALSVTSPFYRQSDYGGASVSYLLLDAESGEICEAYQPDLLMSSASIVKLFTTATALEVLGPDHRFDTYLFYEGKISSGVLDGDIWILPLGDPTLGSANFHEQPFAFLDEWTAVLRQAGISRVKGSVRLLDIWADKQAVSPYWLWEDLGNYYAAGVYSAAIYENTLDLRLRSGAVGEKVSMQSVYPSLPPLQFDVQAVAADNNKDSAYVYGVPYHYQRSVYGSIPAHRSSFRIKADNPNPPATLRWLFQQHLLKAGIVIEHVLPFDEGLSENRDKASSLLADKAFLLHHQQSPRLAEIIKVTNFKSNNLLTEYLARHLAWHLKAGKSSSAALSLSSIHGLPLSAHASLRAMLDFWKAKGMDVSSASLKDACGLAPQTAFSARFMAELLRYMSQQSPYADVFLSTLPLAGNEGTLRSLKVELPGELRLKSGSMTGVRCYAGYYCLPAAPSAMAGSAPASVPSPLAPPAQRTYVLVLMTNHASVPTAHLLRDIKNFLQSSLQNLH